MDNFIYQQNFTSIGSWLSLAIMGGIYFINEKAFSKKRLITNAF